MYVEYPAMCLQATLLKKTTENRLIHSNSPIGSMTDAAMEITLRYYEIVCACLTFIHNDMTFTLIPLFLNSIFFSKQ
jgi:hypothetical protein